MYLPGVNGGGNPALMGGGGGFKAISFGACGGGGGGGGCACEVGRRVAGAGDGLGLGAALCGVEWSRVVGRPTRRRSAPQNRLDMTTGCWSDLSGQTAGKRHPATGGRGNQDDETTSRHSRGVWQIGVIATANIRGCATQFK